MKVLILTNYFPPEIGAASHLFYQLAESLVQRGHLVTVVTGFPRYNVTELPKHYRGKLLIREDTRGMRVVRLRVPSVPRTNPVLRGIEHFLVPTVLFIGGLLSGRHDVVLVYSPPLPFGLAAYGLSRIWRIPFVVNIQDLFPLQPVVLGKLKNKVLIRLFEIIERFVYRKADCITVHSFGNREHVLARGGQEHRVRIVHNWADTEYVRPLPRENAFRREYGLNGRFIVSYAGTMGWCQDMRVIVEAAHELRTYGDILFLLVGDGPEKAEAEEYARRLELRNVMFLPMQPWERYPEVLAASDVSMINLHRNLTIPTVPSKLMNIMAAGRPVVASLPLDGDAPKIVAEANCGVCVEAGDAAGLAEAILKLYRNPQQAREMGHRGRLYAEQHFSRESCIARYEQLFRELSERRLLASGG